jgi:hypothetical protein
VWAYQIGVISDKKIGERSQKVSLWSWALGSVLTMIMEANAILSVRVQRGIYHRSGMRQWHRQARLGLSGAVMNVTCKRTQAALAYALKSSSRVSWLLAERPRPFQSRMCPC